MAVNCRTIETWTVNMRQEDQHLNSTITGSCNDTATVSSEDGIIHIGSMPSKFF
jgi:hypothetical protein